MPKIIAFYLPQYRPVAENDQWFGKGFTEWTNVAKATPLFKGHYQPKVPADLGFYDLRLPEVRQQQAEMAKEAGISAFCYYHYWFGNKRTILEKTLQEVIKSGSPDLPFCLCWANESWFKKLWHSDVAYLSQELLLEQTYGGKKDYEEHFYFLLDAFKDSRYYKIKGKLVFVIYNHGNFPDVENFKKCWDRLAKDNGLPGFYWLSYTINEKDVDSAHFTDYDAMILSLFKSPLVGKNENFLKRRFNSLKSHISRKIGRPMLVYDYRKFYKDFSSEAFRNRKVYPVLVPNWDNTPRRGTGGLIYTNSTPEMFGKHVHQVFDLIKEKPEEDQIVFLKSWNEWGEGNYMEPDLKYGKGYIEALLREIYLFNNIK